MVITTLWSGQVTHSKALGLGTSVFHMIRQGDKMEINLNLVTQSSGYSFTVAYGCDVHWCRLQATDNRDSISYC